MRRSHSLVAALLAVSAAAVTITATSDAGAQNRNRDRDRFASPQRFALELRFAPYRANVDDEPGLAGKTPYRDTFGDDYRLQVGIEFDWQIFRIPYLGTIGAGVGVGYTGMSAKAKLTGSNTESAEDTTLQIFPMYAVAVLRADVLSRNLHIPLVPYAKAGLGYAPWRAYGPNGTARTADSVGKGQSFGTHLALGIALQLDIFDQAAARDIDEAVGINHSYLWAEYFMSNLNNFGGSALRVGANTFAFGLAFEF